MQSKSGSEIWWLFFYGFHPAYCGNPASRSTFHNLACEGWPHMNSHFDGARQCLTNRFSTSTWIQARFGWTMPPTKSIATWTIWAEPRAIWMKFTKSFMRFACSMISAWMRSRCCAITCTAMPPRDITRCWRRATAATSCCWSWPARPRCGCRYQASVTKKLPNCGRVLP